MGYDLDEVRALAPIEAVIGRHVDWDRGKTRAAKGEFWACCPFHAERSPSFKVDAQRGFFRCFGCGAKGDLFSFVMQMDGVEFAEAVRRLAEGAGVDAEGESPAERQARREAQARRRAEAQAREALDRAGRIEGAAEIWAAAQPDHPLLAAYLAARGVLVDAIRDRTGALPATLRLHPDLPFWARRKGASRPEILHSGPAMIARIGREGRFRGVHRTWITETGRARVGGRKLDKRMLGEVKTFGVRFGRPSARMVAGEGIETTLCVWSRLLARGETDWSAEAALSRDALAGPGLDHVGERRINPVTGQPWPSAFPDFEEEAWFAPEVVDELVLLAEGSAKDPVTAEILTRRAERRHRVRPSGAARICTSRLPGGRWDSDLDFADLAAAEIEAGERGGGSRGR